MITALNRNPSEVHGLLLLDSEAITDEQWETHIEHLNDFFGDQEWSGDNTGIYLHLDEDVIFGATPGMWVIRERWPSGDQNFCFATAEQFAERYTKKD